MDIEKELFKSCNKLYFDEDFNATAIIVDAEIDPIKCEFNENSVILDTSRLQYVDLTLENLQILTKLLKEAKKKYNRYYGNK
jgi:hypothetical protein